MKTAIIINKKHIIYYETRKDLVNDMTDLFDMMEDDEEAYGLTEDLLFFLLGRIDKIWWDADWGNVHEACIIAMTTEKDEKEVLDKGYQEIVLPTNLYDYWDILTGEEEILVLH